MMVMCAFLHAASLWWQARHGLPLASGLPLTCMRCGRDKFIRRSQSAVELRSLGLPRQASDLNLKELQQVTVELTTPEGHVYKVGRLSNEERAQKILKSVLSKLLLGTSCRFCTEQQFMTACAQEACCGTVHM